jgi:hypothetical protein
MAQYIAPFDSPVFLLQSELIGKFMYYFYEIRNLNFYILYLYLLNGLLLISYFLWHKLSSETHFFCIGPLKAVAVFSLEPSFVHIV